MRFVDVNRIGGIKVGWSVMSTAEECNGMGAYPLNAG